MLYLKLYKPYVNLKYIHLYKKKQISFLNKKTIKAGLYFKNINIFITPNSHKICLFTFKYKTQLNILKQSRFKLRDDLTFNKNHSWFKFI